MIRIESKGGIGRQMAAVLILVILVVSATASSAAPTSVPVAVIIYTKMNIPKAPKLKDLFLKKSVSQYGITWTFNKPTRVGQFINGDYYVVGVVTVVAIDPKPLVGKDVPESELDKGDKIRNSDRIIRNGSMLNPSAKQEVAFDSGIRNYFKRELLVTPPIAMKPGDSLVSSISLKQQEKVSWGYNRGRRGEGDTSPVRVAAVLTCVAVPQPPDAFRPAFCDRKQKVYLARDLRRELLPRLKKVQGAPAPAQYAEVFRKPWVNLGFFGFDIPVENMPSYGRELGRTMSIGGLLLCLDFKLEEKERLLVNLVQVGIDFWGIVRSGHGGWSAWGGHGSGRKFPIVFAGIMLGDGEMASVSKTFPKVSFGEDEQTAYGHAWTGAKVVFAGHSGISNATGKSRDLERDGGKQWGPYEHLPPSKWNNDNNTSETYRRCCTSSSWVGQALALRILKAEKYWNHDAFFDYVDRWMMEDDSRQRQEINKYWPGMRMASPDSSWAWQGSAWDSFVKQIWIRHRPALQPPPNGWKIAKQNSGGLVLPPILTATVRKF